MPKLLKTPFAIDAAEGFRTDIQESTGAAPNSATYQVGFPPNTMQSIAAGGMPPKGSDLNGVLYDITDNLVFLTQGGGYGFDSSYATSIGGYPLNARLCLTNGDIVKSTIDGNTNDPNTDMTGWVFDQSPTAVILTIEMFGGKTMAQDPLFDNSDALDKMFKSYYSLHGVKSGITFAQLESAVQTSKRVVIQLNGMYRHTRPVDLPPNTTWQQPFEGYFAKAPSMGLFYDAIDLNSYAFGAVLYKKQPDLTYNLDTDVMTTVTGAQFDNGEYFMAAVRQQLINPFIVTKRGVTLAYRFMGWAGNYATNLACGENNGTDSRNPKVAILTGSCWGAKFDHPNTLSLHQGHVHIEAGGGFVMYELYANSGMLDAGVDRNSIIPIYNVPAHTETGTIGLTQFGECQYINPVAENWSIGHLSTHQFHVSRPHMERIDKHAHYLINCEGIIDFKGVTPVEAESVIYLKDYRTFDREVQVRGTFAMGGNLVKGENSDPSIVLNVARSHSFIQYYEWGDLNLIKTVQNKWDADIVYVDPALGDDNYVGLRDIRAFRTLTPAKKLCELFDIRNIQIMGDMEIPSGTDIPKKSTFLGAKLNLAGYIRVSDTGCFDIEFKNSQVNSLTASNVILFSGDFHKGNLNITADINSPSSTLVQSTGSLDIDINIKNTTTNLSIIAFSQIYNPSGVGWNVSTTNYNVTYNLDGGAYFKSIGTIGSGSLTMVSTPVAAGATQVFDISVPSARLGMPATAFHDAYVDGISYTAVVKSSGVVRVMARNYSGGSVSIPAGVLRAKVM